jgi:2-amino-4-hydroxy-6-hydroxymethyldihydropteridine diphosphokinase
VSDGVFFPHTAYISLGSNIEDREFYLHQAVNMLKQDNQILDIRTSNLYETEPIGYREQPLFLNMAIRLYTSYTSLQLLHCLQRIEQQLGRTREIHWGPRTIDLDLLMFDQEQVNTAELQLPHPRMTERNFVLVPLMEILQDEQHPMLNLKQHEMDNKDDKGGIVLWKKTK